MKNLIAITGTPGTGKTSACKILESFGEKVVYLTDLMDESVVCGCDRKRATKLVDVKKLDKALDSWRKGRGTVFVEGHEAHLLTVNCVIVLRCSPKLLFKRLKAIGWRNAKIMENVEAEAIDLITIESIKRHRKVYEIDTSHKSPFEVAEAIADIAKRKYRSKYKPGKIDWLDEFSKMLMRKYGA